MKRTLMLLLTLSLLITAVAGCAGSTPTTAPNASTTANSEAPTTTTSEAPTTTTSEAPTTTTTASNVTPNGQFPVVNEKVSYKCVVTATAAIEDIKTNEFTLWYEEKTNVHIDFDVIPEQGTAEKVSIMLAGGDLPDFFMNASIPDMAVKYGMQEGLIIPLNDLIDNNMIHLQEAFALLPEGTFDALRETDGNIYGLPSINDCFHCSAAAKMWINQVWLDRLDLEMPTTTAEFEDVLIAFRDNDPNQNGIKDEIPLVGAIKGGWHNNIDTFLMNAFIYYDMNSNPDADAGTEAGWLMNDGRIDTALNKDAFKEGLKWLNSLYTQGLIYDASFTQDAAQLTQLTENPDAELVGCVPGGWGGSFAMFPGERLSQYITVPALIGPTGEQNAVAYTQIPAANSIHITEKAVNPEVIVRWADWMYTLEGTLIVTRGFENVGWKKPDAGDLGINGKPAVWTQLIAWNGNEPQNKTWVVKGVYAANDAFRLGQRTDLSIDRNSAEGLELLLYEQTAQNYRPYAKFDKAVPPLKFNDTTMSDLATLKVEYGKYVKQNLVEFITGKKNIDTDWDAYLSGLEAAGLSKILTIFNESYQTIYGE